MKKLFTKSAIAFVMLSLFTASCKKADTLTDTIKKIALKVETTYHDDKGAPRTADGNIGDGATGLYVIVPELPKGYENCNGQAVWSYEIVGDPKYPKVMAWYPGSGKMYVLIEVPGTYKITINYTCGATTISKTITIVVK